MAVTIKSEREIQLMREAGKILAKVHEELAQEVKAGMTSYQIDKICEEIIRGYGCIPSFLGYEGYPGSVCISINDEVVHGLPSKDKIIRDGDICLLYTSLEVSPPAGTGRWKGYERRNCCGKKFKKNTYR